MGGPVKGRTRGARGGVPRKLVDVEARDAEARARARAKGGKAGSGSGELGAAPVVESVPPTEVIPEPVVTAEEPAAEEPEPTSRVSVPPALKAERDNFLKNRFGHRRVVRPVLEPMPRRPRIEPDPNPVAVVPRELGGVIGSAMAAVPNDSAAFRLLGDLMTSYSESGETFNALADNVLSDQGLNDLAGSNSDVAELFKMLREQGKRAADVVAEEAPPESAFANGSAGFDRIIESHRENSVYDRAIAELDELISLSGAQKGPAQSDKRRLRKVLNELKKLRRGLRERRRPMVMGSLGDSEYWLAKAHELLSRGRRLEEVERVLSHVDEEKQAVDKYRFLVTALEQEVRSIQRGQNTRDIVEAYNRLIFAMSELGIALATVRPEESRKIFKHTEAIRGLLSDPERLRLVTALKVRLYIDTYDMDAAFALIDLDERIPRVYIYFDVIVNAINQGVANRHYLALLDQIVEHYPDNRNARLLRAYLISDQREALRYLDGIPRRKAQIDSDYDRIKRLIMARYN